LNCKRVGGKQLSSNPLGNPEQNFAKYSKYGKASIYSASAGEIDCVTFCTIAVSSKKAFL
jgi:hypothetical protein